MTLKDPTNTSLKALLGKFMQELPEEEQKRILSEVIAEHGQGLTDQMDPEELKAAMEMAEEAEDCTEELLQLATLLAPDNKSGQNT